MGSDGVLRTAVTNLLLRSEDLATTWTNSNSTEATDTAIAPNGTLTADTLIPSNGLSEGLIRQDVSGSLLPDGSNVSFSVYVKTAGLTSFNIQFYNKANTFHGTQTVNASTGGLSGSGTLATTTVSVIGDGWFRVSATGMTAGSGATTPNVRIVVTSIGDGTSGIYLWGAQLEQSSTVGEYVPTTSAVNSAPRFDHDPLTGETLGLLVEEQRTNSIRNNTMVGAVAGTPGTLPTNWTAGGAGLGTLAQQIVGTGTQNGINYIDIRIGGTTSTPNVAYLFDGLTAVAATNGQSWTTSSYLSIVGGSTSNLTVGFRIVERTAAGVAITNSINDVTSSLTSTLIRSTLLRTLNQATTAFVSTDVLFSFASGVAIDITLRIGLPQLELGAFASSVIPTTTAAATRSADVVSITGSAFSSWYRQDEGTIYTDHINRTGGTGATQVIVNFNNGGTDQQFIHVIGANILASNAFVNNVSQGRLDSVTPVANTTYRAAVNYGQNSRNLVVNGLAYGTNTGSTPAITQLAIGQNGGSALNGTIRRLIYFPARLPNTTLQRLTQ
jgi:hypothetical protein